MPRIMPIGHWYGPDILAAMPHHPVPLGATLFIVTVSLAAILNYVNRKRKKTDDAGRS